MTKDAFEERLQGLIGYYVELMLMHRAEPVEGVLREVHETYVLVGPWHVRRDLIAGARQAWPADPRTGDVPSPEWVRAMEYVLKEAKKRKRK